MIAPTNSNNFGVKSFSPKLMNLRGLIGMFILVNAALASQAMVPRGLPVSTNPSAGASQVSSDSERLASIQSEVEPETRSWTLAAQKAGSLVFGRSKDSSLSAIRISYNEKRKNAFRLVNVIKGRDKKLYFANEKHDPQTAVLNLTEDDFDRENNCVMLRMKACSKWTRVCDRRIFYLDQQGPEFIQFLIELGKITYNGEEINPDTDLFKRQTERVIGYTVTLMKGNWKNQATTGLMSSWVTNWTGLNKMMENTSQLRVHMNNDGTVKHFEISQFMSNLKFDIKDIKYNEEQNTVLLITQRTKAARDLRTLMDEGGYTTGKNVVELIAPENRYLYLDGNADSKKFLLFLMEMYHTGLTGRETEVFTRAAAAAIPTIFQNLDAEGEKLVQEYIEERKTDNAAKFEDMCDVRLVRVRRSATIRRRRLLRLVGAERRLMQ